MNGIKTNKFIYLFLLIIVGIILFPNNVMAKDTLIECNYRNEDQGSSYTLTIYDDYSAKGDFKTFKGTKINDKGNNSFSNWKSLVSTVKSNEGSDKCPKYALLKKRQPHLKNGVLSLVTGLPIVGIASAADCQIRNQGCDFSAKGYFDLETLKKEKLRGDDHAAALYKVKNSAGKSTLADKNNNTTNNSSSNNQNDSIVGDENYSKCKDFLGDPTNSKSVAWLLQKLFNYVKVLGPILVILFSTIDFTKTILNSDEEAMKKQQKRLGVRLMCAIGIYFLPMVVTLIINLIFGTADANAVCGIK